MVWVFSVKGAIFDSFVTFYRNSGKRRNFAFVFFKTERDVTNAIKLLDGKVFEGKRIQVNKARFGPENRSFGH